MSNTSRGPRGLAFTDYRRNPVAVQETDFYDEEDDVSFLESNDRATPVRQVRAKFTKTDTDSLGFVGTRIYHHGDTHRMLRRESPHKRRQKVFRRRIVL